jgi:hypothetical protein
MPDPLLDEPLILLQLNVPVSVNSVERLQQGAVLAVIDGFDRKVLREPFLNITSDAFRLATNLEKLELISRIMELQKQDKLTAEHLADAHGQLLASSETSRLAVINQLHLISQCPTSEDKVN